MVISSFLDFGGLLTAYFIIAGNIISFSTEYAAHRHHAFIYTCADDMSDRDEWALDGYKVTELRSWNPAL